MTTTNNETKTASEQAHEAFIKTGRIIPDGQTIETKETERDYKSLYEQSSAENKRLNEVIAAGRLQPTAPLPNQNAKPKTFEQARAQVGIERWNHKLTDAEKLVVMGQDPNQDRDFLRKLWGKGADPRLSQDLYKADPRKYRET